MAKTHSGEEIDRSAGATNYTEFTVKKKVEGPLATKRLLFVLLYVAVVVLAFVSMSIKGPGMYLGVLFFLGTIILVYFTWPLTNVEYEYVTASGEMTFTTITAGKSKKENLKFRLKDAEILAPYTSENAEKYADVTKKYDFRPNIRATEDIYFAVINDKGTRAMVLFQCTNKALKIFKSYNKENTVSSDTLRY